MPNMSPKKNEMPTQAPEVRRRNFEEVALGYTEAQAVDEAKRCLNCKNMPCVAGCPVRIHIPAFIAKVAEGFCRCVCGHFRSKFSARRLRPRLPAGKSV